MGLYDDIKFRRKNRRLENVSPILQEKLILSDGRLLRLMVSKGIMQQSVMDDILGHSTPSKQYNELYRHLHAMSVEHFNIFCDVLIRDFSRPDIVEDFLKWDEGRNILFSCVKEEHKILIGGMAGMAKATLVRHLTWLWANRLSTDLRFSPLFLDTLLRETQAEELIKIKDLSNEAKMKRVFEILSTRPNEDYVRFAKAVIQTGQGRHLRAVGFSAHLMNWIRRVNLSTAKYLSGEIPGTSGNCCENMTCSGLHRLASGKKRATKVRLTISLNYEQLSNNIKFSTRLLCWYDGDISKKHKALLKIKKRGNKAKMQAVFEILATRSDEDYVKFAQAVIGVGQEEALKKIGFCDTDLAWIKNIEFPQSGDTC